jgi:hypothetical protein
MQILTYYGAQAMTEAGAFETTDSEYTPLLGE